ncbi:DUF6520 family protein [Christiangramia forsetii]|uniref:Secreted protein n=2 Tax=Christiangramia forsetii TaxID=411153 RepID=A0M158_CHRFK|nr:DUF6520 family protein [Christiangramia forsetii]GGG46317.1 hypothetical protein GCM10011532_32740 [Christiangramia forsetii]CAL66353.1 secreted protein [Christiangramia forsetii KT0803]
MKKLFLIPIMALLVVLGMSFTNLGSEIEEQPEIVANDYVYDNGNWRAIPEQQCTGGTETCKVQFGQDGPVYDLYDEMSLNSLKESSVDGEPIIIQL